MEGYPDSIEPLELKKRLDAGERLTLLDVREDNELELSRLPGITHIPLNELPGRMSELNPEEPIVAICRVGARSRQATEFLRANGFERAMNLKRGMNGYAREADPSLSIY